MKKFTLTLWVLVTVLSHSFFGCGNEYGYSLEDGKRQFTRFMFISSRMMQIDSARTQRKIEELLPKLSDNNFKDWSDYAWNIAKMGQLDSAQHILENLLEKHPNEYNIHANLGTVYELQGNNDKALKHIKKGYELNPDSHYGSEWIHIRILESKIASEGNKDWYYDNTVVPKDSLQNLESKNKRDRRKLLRDIQFQVRTRTKFIPAPNIVLANLLETYGDISTFETYEEAIIAYAFALKYIEGKNYGQKRRIQNKVKKLNQRRNEFTEINDLPYRLKRQIKRGQMDVDLLTIGLVEVGNDLDSVNHINKVRHDSIHKLKSTIDSLNKINQQQLEAIKITEQKQFEDPNYWLFISVALSIAVGFLLFKRGRH